MFAALKLCLLELYRRNAVLTVFAAISLVGVIAATAGMALDTREVTGINAWVKPMKFAASFVVYFASFGWLLSYLPGPRRQVNIISWVTGLGLVLEAPVLVLQAARGVTSHFNVSTLFDAALFGMMGVGAFSQAAMVALAFLLFCKRPIDLPRLPLLGIQAGLGLWVLGVVPGVAMLLLGQHNVGVVDGGPGLPLLNWSTMGGDLRIAHFLGLHAMQVLPVVGFALHHLRNTISLRSGLTAFTLLAGVYTLAMIFTFSQAMAGLPLVAWK